LIGGVYDEGSAKELAIDVLEDGSTSKRASRFLRG